MKDILKTNEVQMPKFGDIYYAELKAEGSIQGGIRPVIVVQNDVGNKYSPTVNIVPLTSKIEKARRLPVHVLIYKNDVYGLPMDSVALIEQSTVINKTNLRQKIATLGCEYLKLIGKAHQIQFPFPV